MKHISKFVAVAFGAAVLLTGCKGKDGDPGPAGATGPSGQNIVGNISGFVFPVDEYGAATAKSGVTVTLDGVTPAAVATSNADGRYEFVAVRSGTYNLTFSRTGLATVRRLGVGHVGGDQPTFLGSNTISANSTTSIGTISVASLSSTVVQINVPFTNAGVPTGVLPRFLAFVSASPGTTAINGALASIFSFSTTSSSPNSVVAGIAKATLNTAGFASGTTVYLVMYGAPSFLTGYTDPLTGKFIYSGLSAPSSQLAFIVP